MNTCDMLYFITFHWRTNSTNEFHWFQWSARKVAKAIGPRSTPLGAPLKVHVASLPLPRFGYSAWTVTRHGKRNPLEMHRFAGKSCMKCADFPLPRLITGE